MPITHVYVDPAIAGNSGSGTVGDPYGDLKWAIETHDSIEDVQYNLKAGTAEVLVESLATTIATIFQKTTSNSKPFLLAGYTSTANDGGIGAINGNGLYGTGLLPQYTYIRNLEIYNCGSQTCVQFANNSCIYDSILHTTDGDGVSYTGGNGDVVGCHIYNVAGRGYYTGITAGHNVYFNLFQNATKQFTTAILGNRYDSVARNMLWIDGSSNGIDIASYGGSVLNNSIYSDGGTGTGIKLATSGVNLLFVNNLVEGFSGSGGIGITVVNTAADLAGYGGNAVFNCATAYDYIAENRFLLTAEETLSASPFAKSGAVTFANRFNWFAPVATGNVLSGAYPTASNLSKGAVQYMPSGGGGLFRPIGGGLVI